MAIPLSKSTRNGPSTNSLVNKQTDVAVGREMLGTVYQHAWETFYVRKAGVEERNLLLGRYFGIFQRFWVEELTLEYVPSVAATQAGVVELAFITDPMDPLGSSGAETAQNVYAQRVSVYSKNQLTVRNWKTPDNGWALPTAYADMKGPVRTHCPGYFKWGAVDTGLADGTSVGTVYLRYKIRFFIRCPLADSTTDGTATETRLYVRDQAASNFVTTQTALVDTGAADCNVEMCTSGGVPVSNDPQALYCAQFDSTGSAGLRVPNGDAEINDGQTVYFKRAQETYDRTTGVLTRNTATTLTAQLGEISLDPSFGTWALLAITGGVGTYVALRNVRRWWRND